MFAACCLLPAGHCLCAACVQRYCKDNPGRFSNADSAYMLSFAIIMLNTDAHNPLAGAVCLPTRFACHEGDANSIAVQLVATEQDLGIRTADCKATHCHPASNQWTLTSRSRP